MPSALLLCVLCLDAAPQPDTEPRPHAERTVAVRLIDGRTVRGRVDPRSDAADLWLVTAAPGVRLVSVFPWHLVAYIAVDLDGIAPPRVPPRPVSFDAVDPAGGWTPAVGHPSRPRTLRVAARLANWDADAEPDGLELTIVPLDDRGRAVRVSGTLDARLVGVSQTLLRTAELDRWGRVVRAEHFRGVGAVYRLPFSSPPLPSHLSYGGFRDGTVPPFLPETFVVVRLGVSGAGVLEAAAPVPGIASGLPATWP